MVIVLVDKQGYILVNETPKSKEIQIVQLKNQIKPSCEHTTSFSPLEGLKFNLKGNGEGKERTKYL